jgi:chorismate mutase/prephenate dehydratase
MTDARREAEEIRQEIAKIDAQMLGVLEKRARASKRLGELRAGHNVALSSNERDAESAIVAKSSGVLPREALIAVFHEVISACLPLETHVRVAYAGNEGGHAHAAARTRFGIASPMLPSESTVAALDEVMRKRADFAVVPYETSHDGPVQATIGALTTSELKIGEVIEVPYDLHVMNKTGNFADVEKIYATQADRAMAAKFLSTLGNKVSVFDVKSPMVACEFVHEDHGAAALTTESFGGQAQLAIARRNVLDSPDGRVRFAIVGSRPSAPAGNDVTAVVFSVLDRPGALIDVLKLFAERSINLIKLHSRPMEGEGWNYLFFVEIVGHATDRPVITAFEEVRRATKFFKVLGSYPGTNGGAS